MARCPHCHCQHAQLVREEFHAITVRGRSITMRTVERRCRHCGSSYTEKERWDAAEPPPAGPPSAETAPETGLPVENPFLES